eukprot:1155311-Pelagomonas_calceolata.AAC.4
MVWSVTWAEALERRQQRSQYCCLEASIRLILGPGVFTTIVLRKMGVPVFWKDLARVMDLGSGQSDCGWR